LRTAVFGDIHANIEAFDAVLADMKQNEVTRFLCTGDVVGYGADPSACIRRLRTLNALTVKGNHDEYSVGNFIPANVTPIARETILWTRNRLTASESNWLERLPMILRDGETGIAHSTFEPAQDWPYIFTIQDAGPSLRLQSVPLAFFGHTHQPVVFIQTPTGLIFQKRFTRMRIKNDCRYLINPGSVGQPRDRNSRAAYVIYDSVQQEVILRRIAYNIESTVEKIIKNGLPAFSARRLTDGI
jgi:diadenosine tetraphosphatase ApaH/serine/threonine PP2A family protein phosphatase